MRTIKSFSFLCFCRNISCSNRCAWQQASTLTYIRMRDRIFPLFLPVSILFSFLSFFYSFINRSHIKNINFDRSSIFQANREQKVGGKVELSVSAKALTHISASAWRIEQRWQNSIFSFQHRRIRYPTTSQILNHIASTGTR